MEKIIKVGCTVTLKSDRRYVVLITRIKELRRYRMVYVEGRIREFGDMKWEGTFPESDWVNKRTPLHRFYEIIS